MSKGMKRFLAVAEICLFTSVMLFAADDFGFNEYLGQIKSFLIAIGGALLLISVSIWAIKAIIVKNVSPNDWKAIAFVGIGGVLLIVAPTVVTSLFSGLGGTNI